MVTKKEKYERNGTNGDEKISPLGFK